MEQSRKDASYMKKKLLICFAMLVCILGLTACGPEMTENSFITKDAAKEKVETLCEDMGGMQQAAASEGKALAAYAEEYAEYTKSSQFAQTLQMFGLTVEDVEEDISALVTGVRSLGGTEEELGNFVSVLTDQTEVVITEDKATVRVKMQGDKVYKGNKQRTATVEVVLTEDGYDSISVTADYDMSELMTKAALNTLLGMGTVFAVLILIYGLISCFNFIPKLQKKFQKKPVEAESAQTAAKTVQPVVVEAETDDTELIAVIAAAIAASEGAASADGYVVRSSIRR